MSVALLSLPITAIVLAALAVAVLGLLEYRLAALLRPEVRVAATLAIVGIGALLSVALTSRTLNEAQRSTMDFVTYDDYANGFAASRWLSLFLIGGAVMEAVRGWLSARRTPFADPARPLLWSMLVFYFGTLLIQIVASEHTGLSHKDLYLPTVLAAVYYQRVEHATIVLDTAKWVLFALTSASLAAMALSPDFVIHRPEPGMIPGITWRLYGLTEHANSLGPAALVAIVLELYVRSPIRLLRYLRLGTAIAVLLLAQSRTTWAAGLVIAVLVIVPLAMRSDQAPASQGFAFRRAVWTLLACIGVTIALALALVSFGAGEYLLGKLELTTLNGRLQIWDITLRAWEENVLFGYGPEIWGVERQSRFHMFHVGHAHNQIVQTLGESGLVGLTLLALFLGVLLRAALSRFVESRGLVLALLLVLCARCVTEAPMRSEGLLSWSTFLHVLILVLACHFLRQPARSPVRSTLASRNSAAARSVLSSNPLAWRAR